MWNSVKESFKLWAYGSPPIDKKVTDTLHEEFSYLLYISCVFMDMRGYHWMINIPALIFNFFVCSCYILFLVLTTMRQVDDFIAASQSLHMAVLDGVALTILFQLNYHRAEVLNLLRAMSVNFFDYGDGFEIPDMKEELRKARNQKLFFIIAIPAYLGMTAACCLLGRSLDMYFGRATNATYQNEVYMMTPVPMYYPMEINDTFSHWFAVFTQVLGSYVLALTVAGADVFLIFFCQAFALQFKILIYRLRNINEIAYRLHRKSGGKKLKEDERFSDANYLKCYTKCLGLCSAHHTVIIDAFHNLFDVAKWATGVVLVTGSIMIAMSLIAFAVGGGKPSILSLAAFLIVAEILNMAMLCSQSELVQGLGESLHFELYNIDWVNSDISAKRTILIMVERSKRPLVLMAGGITPLNWGTFSGILNTSYSYMNLIVAALKEDNKFSKQ